MNTPNDALAAAIYESLTEARVRIRKLEADLNKRIEQVDELRAREAAASERTLADDYCLSLIRCLMATSPDLLRDLADKQAPLYDGNTTLSDEDESYLWEQRLAASRRIAERMFNRWRAHESAALYRTESSRDITF